MDLRDLDGTALFSKTLTSERGHGGRHPDLRFARSVTDAAALSFGYFRVGGNCATTASSCAGP